MFLSRLQLNTSRAAVFWASNPYRVHQRLALACADDVRVLFRIEDTAAGTQIIVQSQTEPAWDLAFTDLKVLRRPPESKVFDPRLKSNRAYRFRLLANPTVKRNGKRLGLFAQEERLEWLTRKLDAAGAEAVSCLAAPQGLKRSRRNPAKDASQQTHYAVLYEGILRTSDPERLQEALATGIGSAKGYGFGLLSLAPA